MTPTNDTYKVSSYRLLVQEFIVVVKSHRDCTQSCLRVRSYSYQNSLYIYVKYRTNTKYNRHSRRSSRRCYICLEENVNLLDPEKRTTRIYISSVLCYIKVSKNIQVSRTESCLAHWPGKSCILFTAAIRNFIQLAEQRERAKRFVYMLMLVPVKSSHATEESFWCAGTGLEGRGKIHTSITARSW